MHFFPLDRVRAAFLPFLAVCLLAGMVGCSIGRAGRMAGTIAPGADWFDTDGRLIEAHDCGVLKVGDTFYLYGVDRTRMTRRNGDGSFFRLNLYSSKDLVNWKFENHILVETDHPDLADPERVVERPKIIYNDQTRQYVMYFHYDRLGKYGLWEVGVASSPTINGRFTYLKRFKPLGADCGDLTLFKDDDGQGYLFHTSQAKLRVTRLTPDYLDVEKELAYTDYVAEAPSVIKINGRYYCFLSGLTGWTHNDNFYCTATSLSGPWSQPVLFVPPGSQTYRSQNTFTLAVAGSQTTTYIYMGDRWDRGLNTSRYVWLPLTVENGEVFLQWRNRWSIDVQTGNWRDVE